MTLGGKDLSGFTVVSDTELRFTAELQAVGTVDLVLTDKAGQMEAGWNRLAGADPDAIAAAVEEWSPAEIAPDLEQHGGGRACQRIAEEIRPRLDLWDLV